MEWCMTDPISISSETHAPSEVEPVAALVAGGVAGALDFALCALWLGPVTGIIIALVATVATGARRMPRAAITFVAAAALSAVALHPSTFALLAAALCFGVALARTARATQSIPRMDRRT